MFTGWWMVLVQYRIGGRRISSYEQECFFDQLENFKPMIISQPNQILTFVCISKTFLAPLEAKMVLARWRWEARE